MPKMLGGPDFDPNTWKIGYQIAPFGLMEDPLPSGVAADGNSPLEARDTSVLAAMANPPADMLAAAQLPIDTAVAVTPNQ